MPSLASLRLVALAPLALVSLVALAGCSGSSDGGSEDGPTDSTGTQTAEDALRASNIGQLARANVHKTACSTNSLGGHAFDSSCSGNGGRPEYWCADFARWVWAKSGAKDTGRLTAAAGSFYTYGQAHHTLHSKPRVGDAAVFGYQGGGYADHVAIVTKVNANGTIETVSGDWGGRSGSEATFAGSSHVSLNAPAYAGRVGTTPSIMGMRISGFVSPVGG